MNKQKLKYYKLIAKYKDCVVVQNIEYGTYTVKDIENTAIAMVSSEERAIQIAENYSLSEIRRLRKEEFENWLKDCVQA